MIAFSRLSLCLLAGTAFSVLVACGEGASVPPVEDVAEAVDSVPATETGESTPEVHAQDEDHAHEDDETHEHDHEEDHAGGSAHVHGIADLALVVEDGNLTAEMISPLANFGLSEADGEFTEEVIAALPGLITLTGGNCAADTPVGKVDTSSGHTDGHVNFAWTCANPDEVTAAQFAGFAAFPGFETINAVFVGEAVQKAAVLTPSSPEISLK